MALHTVVYDKLDNRTETKGGVTYHRPKYAKQINTQVILYLHCEPKL
jgi:hypothetical protein